MANKVGRPTKYNPDYCNLLIEHLTNGFSYQSFAAICAVDIDTLYQWEKDHPDFSEAKRRAMPYARLFWEKEGMKGMQGKTRAFNSTVWVFTMKNRFKWHDNVVIESPPAEKAKDSEIEKLSRQLADLKAIAINDPAL